MVVYITSFEDFKNYVECAKTIFYRVLDNEVRIYAGRVGCKVQCRTKEELNKILEWIESLEQTKTVIEIQDVVSEDVFFI